MILARALTLQSVSGVKRASFNPLSLNPYLWIDAADLSGYTDGTQISGFTERANGYTVGQGVSSACPIYKTGITQSGKPVMRFDGVDDSLVVGGLRLPDTDLSVFVVAKTNAVDTWHMLYIQPAASGNRRSMVTISGGFASPTGSLAYWYNGNTPVGYSNPAPDGQFFQCSVTEKSGSSEIDLYVNGVIGASTGGTDPVQSASDNMRIGCYLDDASFFWSGDIAEIFICPQVTDADRLKMEAYQKAKWGTP